MEESKNKYCGCLYYSASALARQITKMADEAFSPTGMSPSYAFLLMIVNEHPGIQPGDVAIKMQLTPSTVTRLIDKLEHKGFLERTAEGRTIRVQPTKKSRELQDKLKDAWQSLYHHYVAILGEEESRRLTSMCYDAYLKLV